MERASLLFALALVFWLGGPSAGGAETLVGRSVAQMLNEAVRDGLRIVYSSQWVTADLKVLAEPKATDTLERLREILSPHGLILTPKADGVWVVTPTARASRGLNEDSSLRQTQLRAPLAEVTVTGSRYTLRSASAIDGLSLRGPDLQAQPGLVDDPLRAIRRFPGTAGTAYSSRTHVRGGLDNENLIMLDGVPLPDPFRRVGLPADLSLIDPSIIDRVEFYPGVFSSEYGGRLSSVMNLASRRATHPFGGRLGIGFITASALLEGQLPDPGSDWLISARRSTLDLVPRSLAPDIGHPKLFDLFASVHWQASTDWRWSFGLLSAADEVEVAESDRTESSALHSDRTETWVGLEGRLGDTLLQTRVVFNSNNLKRAGDLEDEDGAEGTLIDRRHTTSVLVMQDGITPIGSIALRWGWQAGHSDVRYDYFKSAEFTPLVSELFGVPQLEEFGIATDTGSNELAVYSSLQLKPMRSLMADVGIRWEHHHYDTHQTHSRADPRLTLVYRQNPQSQWRLGWGTLTQFASGAELPVERGAGRYDNPSRSSLWVLGWDRNFAEGRSLRVEIYDRSVDDPWPRLESLLNPLVLVPELRADQYLVAPGRSRARGLDVYCAGSLGASWQGWLSYSLSRAFDRFDSGAQARSWDQRHSLVAGLTTDRWRWRWTAMVTAHSGWPTTEISVLDNGSIELGRRNDARLPWYATLDLKAEHLFDMPRGELRLAAELTNATDRINRCCSSLDFGGEGTVRVDQDSWLPIVPLLSVAWEF